MSSSIAVIILTFNEAVHIARAINSVKSIAKEVFVVDSGSTDRTTEIAASLGAKILVNPFVNQAVQFQWALDTAPITAEWILRLDADEVIEPDLVANITAQLPLLPEAITGVKFKRKHIFMGRWIRHGGRYPLILLRLWRKGAGRIENRWMDEHAVLNYGRSTVFEGGFSDINLGDLSYFTEKHNKYATREAVDVLNKKYHLFSEDEGLNEIDSNSFKRRVKEGLYNKLPFGTGPILYFLYRYFIGLGFLDGKEGAIYHGLQGLWYRYLVDAKVLELERGLSTLDDAASRVNYLREATGLRF